MKDLCKKITLFFTPRAWRFFPEVFDLAPDPVNFRLYLKNPMANTEQHKNLQALERGGGGGEEEANMVKQSIMFSNHDL